MEREMNERLEALELEMKSLRNDVAELKRTPALSKAPIVQKEPEKPLTKYFFPEKVQGQLGENTDQKEAVVPPPKLEPAKPKKSLEESFMWALPKIFMVILVLGVLWGLKLVSNYGYLSDTLKIVAGFIVSIILLGAAYVMEKKEKGAPALITPLYGGAFVVGILTTAAGAILYDVLGLYVALIIALIYIAYGIGMSYIKGNEGLTVFVAFTSLLLPYLLEYMDFSAVIIVVFVIVLMAALLLVLLKHKQATALYVSQGFSMLALSILLFNTMENEVYILLALIVVTTIFYFGWWRICSISEENLVLHMGLLFSLSSFVLIIITLNASVSSNAYLVNSAFLAAQAAFIALLWKEKKRDVVDVIATIAMLTILNLILNINTEFKNILLLMLLSTFVGLMVALKLRASFMKFTYSCLFILVAFIIYGFQEVSPFVGIENLSLLLVPVFILSALIYINRRPKEELTWFEKQLESIRFLEIVPVLLYTFVFWYISKFERSYPIMNNTEYGYNYWILIDLAIALLFAVIVMIPVRYSGYFLPVIAGLVFAINSLSIIMDSWSVSGELMWGLIVRVVYFGVVLAVVADVWFEGRIYKNFENTLAKSVQVVHVIGVIWAVLSVFGFTNFLNVIGNLSWSGAVIINTISIFLFAIIALLLGTQRDYTHLKLTGASLLIFAFVKMIFFDLSNLDLLVRSVLFIVIGGVGLLISTRLLKK